MTGGELLPSAHRDPPVRRVLTLLVKDEGWSLTEGGHWGVLRCPCARMCTTISVGGTPKNPGQEAKRIARLAKRCPLDPDDARRNLTGMPRNKPPKKTR
jgi:hypothetical protein